MARPKANTKSLTVTLPADLYDFVDDLHWIEHVERATLYREAVETYAISKGYKKPASDDAGK